MATRPELPADGDSASNGRPWGDKIRGWLAALATDVDSVLPAASPYVQGQGGVRAVRFITQADYTALAVKDPYTLYLIKQVGGSINVEMIGGATNPTPPPSTPTAPTGTVSGTTQTAATIGTLAAPSSDGGSPITGYRFFAYNPSGTSAATFNPEWVSPIQATLPATYTFTGLTAGTLYQVGVFAINANGEGARLRLNATTQVVPDTGGGGVGGGGGLPVKVSAVWYLTYQRPRLRELPADVRNINNHYMLSFATSGGSGTGNLVFSTHNGETMAELKADVMALRAEGKNVVIGIGGADAGNIAINNSTQVTQAYNSILTMVTNTGANGIDIDLEPGSSTWEVTSLASLCQQLKTNYGSSFIIGVTPALYSPHTTKWMSLAQTMGANMDYMAPMLYDFPEAADSRLSAVAVQKADIMAAAGIPQSKMIMGYMCVPPEGWPSGASTPQLTLDAHKAVQAKYPSVRGGFVWDSYIESRTNYQWTRLTGKYIRGL